MISPAITADTHSTHSSSMLFKKNTNTHTHTGRFLLSLFRVMISLSHTCFTHTCPITNTCYAPASLPASSGCSLSCWPQVALKSLNPLIKVSKLEFMRSKQKARTRITACCLYCGGHFTSGLHLFPESRRFKIAGVLKAKHSNLSHPV